jgi:hypothetical protein
MALRGERLGDAEVEQLHAPVAGEDHVGRADVAVREVEQRAVVAAHRVHVGERARQVQPDAHGRAPGQRAAALHQPHQVHPVEVLHHHVLPVGTAAARMHVHQVRVIEPHRQLRLRAEHGGHVGIAGEVRKQPLDRDFHGPPFVVQPDRAEHLGHAALSDPFDHVQVAEAGQRLLDEYGDGEGVLHRRLGELQPLRRSEMGVPTLTSKSAAVVSSHHSGGTSLLILHSPTRP